MSTLEPIPLTVIGGYLGAGKTTLLNHLLRHNAGRRLAVVVNDFGSINIDASLIAHHDGETVSLTNGCICCSLSDGFMTTLNKLIDRPDPPEHIIVEASGVADPLKIGQYGHVPGFRLDGVIVLADVETVQRRSRDRYVGRTVIRQLHGADIVVVTKTDLVTNNELDGVREWLRAIAPNASLVEVSNGIVPPELILDGRAPEADTLPRDQRDMVTDHELAYETWTYEQDGPMTVDTISAFAEALPEEVLRAKGLVYLIEDPEHAAIFQMVGKRWSLTEGPAWDAGPPHTAIVVIGIPGSLDWPLVKQQLDECCSD